MPAIVGTHELALYEVNLARVRYTMVEGRRLGVRGSLVRFAASLFFSRQEAGKRGELPIKDTSRSLTKDGHNSSRALVATAWPSERVKVERSKK